MDERELATLAEEARQRLLAQPRESVWESVQNEPIGSFLLVLLLYIFLGFPLALISFITDALFGFELSDLAGWWWVAPFLPPATYAAWVFRDNERKHQSFRSGMASALPTTVARTYCATFPRGDKLWRAMDYLWREGEARAFGFLNALVLESIEDEHQSLPWDVLQIEEEGPQEPPF
jgi:hypothetical protein